MTKRVANLEPFNSDAVLLANVEYGVVSLLVVRAAKIVRDASIEHGLTRFSVGERSDNERPYHQAML